MGRTVCVGRVLGFLEFFPFFQDGRRPWAHVGPVCVTHVFRFSGGSSPPIRLSLIVVPDRRGLLDVGGLTSGMRALLSIGRR